MLRKITTEGLNKTKKAVSEKPVFKKLGNDILSINIVYYFKEFYVPSCNLTITHLFSDEQIEG